MAAVPISYKDQTLFINYLTRPSELESSRCIASIYSSSCKFRRWRLPSNSKIFSEAHLRFVLLENAPCRKRTQFVCHANESSTNEEQLRALDAYFKKVQYGDRLASANVYQKMEFVKQRDEFKSKKGLESLDAYLGKVKIGD